MHDLKVKASWDQWHVLILQNRNVEGRTYDVRFSRIGLDDKCSYLVYHF